MTLIGSWCPFFCWSPCILYPKFIKSAKRGSHHPAPLSVNVADWKKIPAWVKRHMGDPKEILGFASPQKTYARSREDLKWLWESQTNASVVSNGHGEAKEIFASFERAGASLKRPWRRPVLRKVLEVLREVGSSHWRPERLESLIWKLEGLTVDQIDFYFDGALFPSCRGPLLYPTVSLSMRGCCCIILLPPLYHPCPAESLR